jgi:large subunit ribosomal protein L22
MKSENKNHSAVATLSMVRSSVYKASKIANLIRGLSVNDAMLQLTFSKVRLSIQLKDLLKSCIANAENNHNMDISTLYIKDVCVGKNSNCLKRFMPRGRGRASMIEKHFVRISIILSNRFIN